MTLKGFASAKATGKHSEKYKEFKYNALGKTGLLVSEIGFGGLKIDIRSPLNRDALKKALLSGINLLDTSSNFTDGNSESLVGDVIEEIINADLLSREAIVIVTKGGCLQGENYELSKERKEDGCPYPDLIEYEDGFEYCIHPECLEEQITFSLERLNLETVDIYLLDSPEYYLKWAQKNKLDKETAAKKYYAAIKKAFEYLEKEVQRGRIKHYGVCSDSFINNSYDYIFTSLEKLINIASEISKDNHFSVVEFPLNLYETGAVLNKNYSNNMTLLELAEKENLGVLTNRPINTFFNNKSIKFAEPVIHNAPTAEIIIQELKNIKNIEKTISEKLKLLDDKEIEEEIKNNLFVYDELADIWQKYEDIFSWNSKLNQHFLPRFHYYKNFIKTCGLKNEEFEMDLFSCTFKIGKLFSLISAYYNNEYLKFANNLKKHLSDSIPEIAEAKKLSSMTLRALLTTKGVSSVLTGMGQIPYVIDALEELKSPVNGYLDWNKIKFNRD